MHAKPPSCVNWRTLVRHKFFHRRKLLFLPLRLAMKAILLVAKPLLPVRVSQYPSQSDARFSRHLPLLGFSTGPFRQCGRPPALAARRQCPSPRAGIGFGPSVEITTSVASFLQRRVPQLLPHQPKRRKRSAGSCSPLLIVIVAFLAGGHRSLGPFIAAQHREARRAAIRTPPKTLHLAFGCWALTLDVCSDSPSRRSRYRIQTLFCIV